MKRVAAAVCCLLALSGAAWAQVVTGSIVGTVRDESGLVLPGVTVTLTSPDLPSGPATFVTNEQGEYRFTNLRPGSYTLKTAIDGFSQYEESDLVVVVGGTTERRISLKLAALEEKVTVSGQSPIIDLSRVAVTTNLPQQVIENIPSMRYGFHEFVKWAPGVAASDIQGSSGNASVLGSSSSENTFLYEGVNSNDPRNGGLWLGGAVNAVQ
jgi:Carboxypeptidase regulatory-like domain